jgi:exopolysaccharide biosynthesis polyprenyl glycosylphosphotransferase
MNERQSALEAQPSRRSMREALTPKGFNSALAARCVVDVIALLLALALAFRTAAPGTKFEPRWGIVAFPLLVVALLTVRGLYANRLQLEALDILVGVVTSVSVAALVVLGVGDLVDPDRHPVMLRLWGCSVLTVALGRTVLAVVERRRRTRGHGLRRTVIAGAGEMGVRLAERLREHPEYGLRPVAFVDSEPHPELAHRLGVPVLGDTRSLPDVAGATQASQVLVAFPSASDRDVIEAVRRCHARGVHVSVVPRLFDLFNLRCELECVGGMPLVRLNATDPHSRAFFFKHAFDRIIALCALVVSSPLMLVIALAVRMTSPGPVTFRQRRVGRDGREFDLLKFRSMRVARETVREVTATDRIAPGGVEGQDRRTLIGRWLRRTSLDELPQLINIAKGDMSIVGPRPERPEYVREFERGDARYSDRLRVKAGLTGLAQVHNLRGKTSLEKRVEWDNYYIENWSPWLDVKIVARTLMAIIQADEKVT